MIFSTAQTNKSDFKQFLLAFALDTFGMPKNVGYQSINQNTFVWRHMPRSNHRYKLLSSKDRFNNFFDPVDY